MLKIKLILFAICTSCAFALHSQSHISNAFCLEKEWVLPSDGTDRSFNGLVGCTDGEHLFFCHRQGFQDKTQQYRASLFVVDLNTGKEESFHIAFPEKKASPLAARKYWIRGLSVKDDQLFLLTQDAVLTYQKGRGQEYTVCKVIPCDLPTHFIETDGNYFIVEKVPEEGKFVMKKFSPKGVFLDSICQWSLSAPFMLQYEPNDFLSLSESGICFLDSPFPIIHQHLWNGSEKDKHFLPVPQWNPMPEEFVKKVSAMPYGSERAMYVFSHSQKYSFPLAIHLLRDNMFLIRYHTMDTLSRKERIVSAVVKCEKGGQISSITPYSHYFASDSIISENAFPLYYAQRELCLNVQKGEFVVQIVRETPVEWRRKMGKDFYDSTEAYFYKKEPIIRVRTARLKWGVGSKMCPMDSLHLKTADGQKYVSNEKRTIYVVNNPPQCHSCEENIYQLLNSMDTNLCQIAVVTMGVNGALARRDNVDYVKGHLNIPFIPLYVDSNEQQAVLETLQQSYYPMLLLREEEDTRGMIVPNANIFSDDGVSSTLNPDFKKKMKLFMTEKTYVIN